MSSAFGLQDIPFELWENGWAIWSKQRKRARMAQFIIDHLHHRKSANWIDITKGKFELCNWQEVAQEWYHEKKRDSDITDATSILRKGLPRAFPGLFEVKAEAVRDGTQYIKRVFQAPDSLLHDVLRCALQGDVIKDEESPSSGDEDHRHLHRLGFGGLTSPTLYSPQHMMNNTFQQSPMPPPPFRSYYDGSAGIPYNNPYAASVSSIFQQQQQQQQQQQRSSSHQQATPYNSHTPSPGGVSLVDAQLGSSSTIHTLPDNGCNVDSAVESVAASDLLTSTFSPMTQMGSPSQSHQPSVDSGSGSIGSPFSRVNTPFVSAITDIAISSDVYDPVVTATTCHGLFDANTPPITSSSHDNLTSTGVTSPSEFVSSPPQPQQFHSLPPPSSQQQPQQQQQQPPFYEPQLDELCLGVSPKRSSTAGGEPLYVFSSGSIPIPEGQITLVFYSVSLHQYKRLDLCRANDFNYTAIIPAHSHPEIVNLHVIVNGQPVLEDQFEYYDASPSLSDFLTGDVHDQLSQLYFLLGEVLGGSGPGVGDGGGGGGISLSALQGGGSGGVQGEAAKTPSSSASKLIVFSARLGVPSLMRLLLQLPYVDSLLKVTDKNGVVPAEIAKAHGHFHMAECMTKIQERLDESASASIDDLLDTLASSKIRASDCIASITMAVRRIIAQEEKTTPRASEETMTRDVHHAESEEKCIEEVIRSHRAQVERNEYARVLNEQKRLKAEYVSLSRTVERLESERNSDEKQLKSLHGDRLTLLKLVARWNLQAVVLYRHLQANFYKMNSTVAQNLALKEEAKVGEEEKKRLKEEKETLTKELEQLKEGGGGSGGTATKRSDKEEAALTEKYMEMYGLLEAARSELVQTHQTKDWLMEEHKKVLAENQKLGETVKTVNEMRAERDETLEAKDRLSQEFDTLKINNKRLEEQVRQLKASHEEKQAAAAFINQAAAEPTPSLSDSAIGSIESQSTTESTQQLPRQSRPSHSLRRLSPPEFTSLSTMPSMTKELSFAGPRKGIQDLGFQLRSSFFLQDITVANVRAAYDEGYDRLLEINGKPVEATNVKDVERIMERSLKKEGLTMTLARSKAAASASVSRTRPTSTSSSSSSSSITPQSSSSSSTSTGSSKAKISPLLTPAPPLSSDPSPHDPLVHAPREVVIQRPESGELGFKVNGGNAVGIFVSAVGNTSIGLKKMDQLLELQGCNLRQATKEDVMEALTKVTRNPTTNQVKVLAQFNPEKYACLRDLQRDQLDSFHIRCQTSQLRFELKDLKVKRGDVLHVIESMHKIGGQVTSYLAWKVNLDGTEVEKGTVPNRTKASELYEKKNNDVVSINPYQRVALQRPHFARPLLLYGDEEKDVKKELLKLYPHRFSLCPLKNEYKDISEMDKMVESLELIDYDHLDEGFSCVGVDDVRSIASQHKHCILDVNAFCIVRLQAVDLHPIVICLKSTTLPSEILKIVEKHQAHTVIEADNVADACKAVSDVVASQQLERLWLSI